MKSKVILLAVVVGLAGCGNASDNGPNESAGNEAIRVVATTPIVADFVSVIGGDKVQLHDAVQANVDLHDYEPSPADLEALNQADLIIKNGVGLESWLDETVQSAGGDAVVVDSSAGIQVRVDESGEQDPHIWHDPKNVKLMTKTISNALAQADPTNAATYEENQANYSVQLDELHAATTEKIRALSNKKLVTNHDALGYYVAAYGLDYIGAVIPSFDSQAELSSAEISELVSKIRAEGVKAVFSESTLPPNTARTIAAEANVKVVEGDDAIYGDSLGVPGSGAATYLEMEEHNTNAIVANLS